SGCRGLESHGASLKLTDRLASRQDKLEWKFRRGQMTLLSDFGDPTTTADFVLCIYDSSGGPQPIVDLAAPSGGVCKNEPCWALKYLYRDPLLTPDGLGLVKLREGQEDGRTELQFKGKGSNLGLPPGIPLVAPVVVQSVSSETGVCWQATFSTLYLVSSPTK